MDNLIHFKLPRHFNLTCVLILVAGLQIQTAYGQIGIRGKVVDENNEGLPGTTVAIRGASTGTITDENGNYSLEVQDAETVLVFTYVGYATQEIEVGNLTEINVQMTPEYMSLDQVVVVGYGTQRKKDITGSIAIADTEIMEKSESTNITNRLQGLVPGVKVIGNGEPGSIGRIRIRGNVFTGVDGGGAANQPLFVIDGVLTDDNSFLNPNDIESVQVLKDASSSAIYGSTEYFLRITANS
jgi:outer membrane receptor protein involved in Fe transport